MQSNKGDTLKLFRNQNFYSIRDWLLKRNIPFEDPLFELDVRFEWLRPGQIINNPELFVGGASRFDINQGFLGDCWMLASMTALAVYPDLVKKVVPSDQSFSSQYAGIFHFHIWRFGTWYDVVIDDRLPTVNGQLVNTRSISGNEFWTVLLEKAYCKVLGGNYEAADAGNLCEALEDFTGGIVEQYNLGEVPKNFENVLVKSVERGSLMGCFINPAHDSSGNETPLGLLRGHSYSVTGAKSINIGYGDTILLRIRNPYGMGEWNGPWSDNSPEWTSVPASTKQELGIVCQDEGEFWMSYSDFVSNFEWMDMCHLSPESFIDASGNLSSVSSWYLNTYRGSWVSGVSAGGANNMHLNPQITFTLSESDDDDFDGFCSVLIALIQKKGRDDHLNIGFKVYQLRDPNETTLDENFFLNTQPVAEAPLDNAREVASRFNLLPDAYCVIPFAKENGEEAEFLVRIYSEKATEMQQTYYTPIMQNLEIKIADESVEDENTKLELMKNFDKVSGADKEVDWKELKTVLDITVKERSHTPDENWDYGHFLLDIIPYMKRKIFGKSRITNAYQTLGPDGFSYDVCRSMVALLDVDHSGKLGFNEFHHLWGEIKNWKSIYEKYSENTDGYLNSSGLKEALEATGFNLNRQTLSDIVHRYSTKDNKMSFDDFLHCTIKIKAMVEFFRSKDENNTNKVQLTLEEYLDKAIYS